MDSGSRRHGTHWMYIEYRCRCQACRDFHNAYTKRYKIQRELGGPARLVAVDESRRHIHVLEQMRFTQAQIAEATGVAQSHISRVAAGHTKRVRREVAEKISAGYRLLTSRDHGITRTPRAGLGHPRVKNDAPAVEQPSHRETRAILREALKQGRSMAELAEHIDVHPRTLRRIYSGAPPGQQSQEAIAGLGTLLCIAA